MAINSYIVRFLYFCTYFTFGILKLPEKLPGCMGDIKQYRNHFCMESIGARVNIVGSLKSGLMMKNLDIDMHI